jgi:hypothetical protein
MLTRRRLLSGVALGGLAAVVGRSAAAFTIEPMPKPVAGAFALACKPLAGSGGDHNQLIADAQALLRREISGGVLPATAQQVVVCPICGCRFTVTASAAY